MAISTIGTITSAMSCLCTQNLLSASLSQQFRYLRRPRKNLKKLKSLMEELDARKVDVSTKLKQMWLFKGMNPKASVELWLKNVESFSSEVSELIRENEQGSGRTGGFFSPRCVCSRIKLGKLIEKKILEVRELLEKGQFSDDSMAETSPKKGQTLPTTKLMEHRSTMKVLSKVWQLLFSERTRKIGIYGMGGVGKTTILIEINNLLLKEDSLFDCVIWISSPKETANPEKLQKAIAEKFNLDLSRFQDETTRAASLFEAFQRRRRFALILDDLWEPFSLERVGIPTPTMENGSKLLISTRKLSVCRGMETDRDVKMKVLDEDEAWDLFRNKVGDEALVSPDIERIARDVAKECMGLPLGIVTVGRALRNETDVSEWEIALLGLKASSVHIEQMEELVFSRLKFSFTRLKDDTSRSCFLFCALYPEGNHIDADELIEYWMWEGLLGSVENIKEGKQKGNTILNELKYACLLETAEEKVKDCVRMHDLIRDMAIRIMRTYPNWHCIVKAGNGLTKPPQINEWIEDVQRVSLMKNDLKSIFLGNPPPCPQATSLLLQYNSFPQNIPHDFFDFLQGLKVLDLSYTGIDSLPGSVSNLENLCALLLSNCWNLRVVPSLAKLIKLMTLDLSCCWEIKQLPHGTEQLGNLRRLNISNTMIRSLPSGFISALNLLEELLICNALEFQIPLPPTSAEISIDEFISSSSLSSLEVDFWSLDLYVAYTRSGHWVQLDKFKFNVGPGDIQEVSERRSITFLGIHIEQESPILIPESTLELIFSDCHDLTGLTTSLVNAEKLRKCTVLCCYSIKNIVDPGQNDLSMLETMVLRFLMNLRMICRKVVTPSTLINLKIITVEYCPSLKNLFQGPLLLQLQNLEEIKVSHCESMEKLVRWKDDDDEEDNIIHAEKIQLPKLQKLRLEFVPKLKEIYFGLINFGSLCCVQVISCDALKRLPFDLEDEICNSLEIKGSKYWWESLEWDEPSAKQIMETYFIELPIMESAHTASSGSQVGVADT